MPVGCEELSIEWRPQMIRYTVSALMCIVVTLAMVPQLAVAQNAKQTPKSEKVRAKVLKLGTGENAKVKVKLSGGTSINGFVGSTTADGFTVVEANGTQKVIAFSEVDSIAARNLSTGAKIGIGIGIGLGILAIIAIIAVTHFGD